MQDKGTVTFKVTVTKAASKFIWQASEDGGKNWENTTTKKHGKTVIASDKKSSTLAITANDDNYGRLFRCVVTISGKNVASDTFYVEPTYAGNFEYAPYESTDSEGNPVTGWTILCLKPNAKIENNTLKLPAGTCGIKVRAIQDGNETTEAGVFTGATELIEFTSVIIPKNITKIGSYAFSDCTSLGTVSLYNAVDYIGKGAFKNCTSLSTMTPNN